jgi:hypothetical protein
MELFTILEEESGTIHTVAAETLTDAYKTASKHQGTHPSTKSFTQYSPDIHGGIDQYRICCNTAYHKEINQNK